MQVSRPVLIAVGSASQVKVLQRGVGGPAFGLVRRALRHALDADRVGELVDLGRKGFRAGEAEPGRPARFTTTPSHPDCRWLARTGALIITPFLSARFP